MTKEQKEAWADRVFAEWCRLDSEIYEEEKKIEIKKRHIRHLKGMMRAKKHLLDELEADLFDELEEAK